MNNSICKMIDNLKYTPHLISLTVKNGGNSKNSAHNLHYV